jgi:hypothetical protein
LPCPGHAQFLLKAAGAAGVLGALDAEPRSNAPPSVNPALTTRRACTQPVLALHKTHRLTQAEAFSFKSARKIWRERALVTEAPSGLARKVMIQMMARPIFISR